MFTTYKNQTFEIKPIRGNFHIFQDEKLVGIALNEECIDILIKDRVDYPNAAAAINCRYD